MATAVEYLLRATLAKNADYKTIQLLKAGKLAEAAVIVLKARRRMILLPGLMVFFVIFMGLGTSWITASSSHPAQSLATATVFPLLGLLNVVLLIQANVAVSRLETMLMIWLQGAPESSSDDRDALLERLSKPGFGRH